jgi:hypothetical protein
MRIRARKRICEALEAALLRDVADLDMAVGWVNDLVSTGVERDIIEAVAKEIATTLRGIARSVRS